MINLLHNLLIESTRTRPDNEAVRFNGASLTYAELDALSNQVARALQASGVGRGDRVGIFVHKSPSSIISIFGILKAGGVYVPLDPNSPPARTAYIIRNCNVEVLLTSSQKLPALRGIADDGVPVHTILLLDEAGNSGTKFRAPIQVYSWFQIRSFDSAPILDVIPEERDIAYILYTSGSTGEPKGVMISHRTIFTFINWCSSTFQVTDRDRVTSHAPLHFDLSTFDIFVTIGAGGTIVLVPESLSIFPESLADLIQDERITITYLVPSILSMMVNYGKLDAHDFSSLRIILFAGEVFPIKYLRRLVELIPRVDYFNLYGPTETNVCTFYKVRPEDVVPGRDSTVPIGKACENMETFAIDEQGNQVTEPGIEGELYVRGAGVAQGYWGDPEKTAEGFVRNPLNSGEDDIVYRTGDVVVLAEDGENWRLVGRRDHLIKSRGYRIELGEIEAAFHTHHGVRETAAIAIPDDLIGNRIKAFVVPLDGKRLTAKELEAHCARILPRYMLPESIEFIDELPKTSTGKIDRPYLARKLSSF